MDRSKYSSHVAVKSKEDDMTKSELVNEVAKKANLSKKDAEKAITTFTAVVEETLRNGDSVQLTGFGKFAVSKRPVRTGRNPKTGEPMTIPASNVPKFVAGKALKEALK